MDWTLSLFFGETVVRDYVGPLRDRSVQRCLRGANRNVCYSKVAINTGRNETIVCETDDLVLEFRTNYSSTDELKLRSWFIKQEEKYMLPDELDTLRS